MIFHSTHLITEQGTFDGYLVVENGVITDIVRKDVEELTPDVDYGDKTVMPGIFDTHNHGYMGWDPGESVETVLGYCKALASAGVTAIFPTVDEPEAFEKIYEASKKNDDGARLMGIHSEGPYLNRVGEKGVDTGHPEIDLDHIQKMIDSAHGMLKLLAIAPELEGSREAIRLLTKNGVRVAFAHSNQTYEEAMESFKNGITVITHTANVMSGLHHRNMGGLGAAILDDDVYNELICDGLHVRNEMIDLILRVKHNFEDKVMMISDNVQMAGFPAGRYMGFWGPFNITEEGYSLTDTGRLAGSAKPVIYGMRNLVKNLHLPLELVSRMASLNPCRVYGFADRKGSLRNGKDADFTVIDDDFNVYETYREGKKVFDCKTDTDLLNHEYYERTHISE